MVRPIAGHSTLPPSFPTISPNTLAKAQSLQEQLNAVTEQLHNLLQNPAQCENPAFLQEMAEKILGLRDDVQQIQGA